MAPGRTAEATTDGQVREILTLSLRVPPVNADADIHQQRNL
jgi:hypothetical protein